MEIKSYYNEPTMVSFLYGDEDDNIERIYGIAYNDVIICSCCGGIFLITEVIETAEENDIEFEEYDWVPFTDYIS
jgi:hypothetical protein